MAGTAIDLIEDPEILVAAKEEFDEVVGDEGYLCPIPDGCKPRAIGMSKA